MAVEELVIEQMGSRHLDDVLAIERRSYSIPWSSNSFKNEMYNQYSIALAALLGGSVVGYILASYRFHEGHILNVTVHHEHARKGIGTHLLQLAMEMLKERQCTVAYLEVRASNLAARQLYEKMGFQEFGRRKAYYIDPFEDAVLMTAKL